MLAFHGDDGFADFERPVCPLFIREGYGKTSCFPQARPLTSLGSHDNLLKKANNVDTSNSETRDAGVRLNA